MNGWMDGSPLVYINLKQTNQILLEPAEPVQGLVLVQGATLDLHH